ncbi:hypothetical protein D1AOALGA4SA_12694 [Olavius algarvensis Delta 1 endosymbiont]|nr:hypothetical protein D1AOALGA4SA_12694 [Olavius algarvensis Delta 1 endosymbiont]
MDETKNETCSTSDIARLFAECRTMVSPLEPEFGLAGLLADTCNCRIVKANSRRQLYHLQTPENGYFLKCSTLVRPKDRLRHFLLPRRRWAEWHNLHRLRRGRVPSARPLAKGQSVSGHPGFYFILTRQVDGVHIPLNCFDNACNLGQYAAFLHRKKVYHSDFNRKNFILNPQGEICLLDAQQVYFPPLMPRRWRVKNLGRLSFHFCTLVEPEPWAQQLITGYNCSPGTDISAGEVLAAARRHRQRRLRSRAKRCCKNSSEFEIIKNTGLRGFKQRDFSWGRQELHLAEKNGISLKGAHVIAYRGVCLKTHRLKWLHQNRCLASWKMSQALAVRGITVPRALGYFETKDRRYFLAELLDDRLHLNAFLSELSEESVKRPVLKKLALWLRLFHDTDVWQRDFKSSNILCRNSEFYMVDLDGVRIRRLSNQNKIYNLAQLNASISNKVSIKDRLRFYRYYSTGARPTRQQRRAVYRQVWHISKTKNTKIYNLDFDQLLESQVQAGPVKQHEIC